MSIAGIQLASANMLSPAAMDTFELGFKYSHSNNNSMYLGQWRNEIASKLMPSYFNQLSNISNNDVSYNSSTFRNANYVVGKTRLITTVFTNDVFSDFADDKILNFSFTSEINKLNQNTINANFYNVDRIINSSPRIAIPPTIIKHESYSPGYIFTTGKNIVSVNAVLIQQKFSDNNISTSTFQYPSSHYQGDFDEYFYNVNRGTGYSLNYQRNLISDSYINIEYNSEIRMHEFGSFGKNYSDSGDFDIPKKLSLALGIPFLDKNIIEFSAEKISYSQVDANTHSGYLYYFRNHVNSFLRPNHVSFDDLTVYSISFEQTLSESFAWILDVSSSQQARTSSVVYNNALNRDTAKFSYKVGLSHNTTFGSFDLFASLANKPILIGSTDFGRFTNTSLSSHVEGVASWSIAF